MRLPGFTAEASLYKTSQSYQMTGSLVQADGGIHPAQCRPIRGFRDEQEYIDCRLDGRPHSTCCLEVTGSSCCYFA